MLDKMYLSKAKLCLPSLSPYPPRQQVVMVISAYAQSHHQHRRAGFTGPRTHSTPTRPPRALANR